VCRGGLDVKTGLLKVLDLPRKLGELARLELATNGLTLRLVL